MIAHTIIIILGPTASGKTALGVRLAKQFQGVVVSADSRQVYRGMNIGTGKVTKKEMRGVPHYLLDMTSPKSQYSVAKYVRDVVRVLKKIPATTPIFLVGGTPFYIDALTKPNLFSPVPPNPALRRRLVIFSTSRLIGTLRRLDPERLRTIDVANRRRLIRAIEIASHRPPPPAPSLSKRRATPILSLSKDGEEVVTRRGEGVVSIPPMSVLKIGIAIDKKKLHRNIARRVDVRMRQGMLREVQRLHDQGVSWNRLDAFGLEYRFLTRYLRGQITKPDAIIQLNSAIRNFAKRQMTWWKRDQDIHWITDLRPAVGQVKSFLARP